MSKKRIKMRVVDWCVEDSEEQFYSFPFVRLLQDKFEIVYSSEPDFIFYSCFGNRHLDYDCVRIL